MKSDIRERNNHNHEDKGDQDHHADHQLPVDQSINKGAKTDDDFKPDVEYTDSEFDDDDAFDSMIQIIRVAQWGGIEFSWLKSQRDRQLRPDEYATPAPQLLINEDGEVCINPHSIAKQVPRQTFSPANNEESTYNAKESVDSDEEDFDLKQNLLVEELLPREFFAMETQAIATMVLIDMDWHFVGYIPSQLRQPIEETCLAILFVFDKIGVHCKAKGDLPLDKKASKGNVKRAYIDVVKNWLFKWSVFGAIAKDQGIADDIARWKKHRPMLFDDPNNVLEGWKP